MRCCSLGVSVEHVLQSDMRHFSLTYSAIYPARSFQCDLLSFGVVSLPSMEDDTRIEVLKAQKNSSRIKVKNKIK